MGCFRPGCYESCYEVRKAVECYPNLRMALIEIECSPESLFKMFDSSTVTQDTTKQVPGGGTIRLGSGKLEKRFRPGWTTDAAPLVTIALTVGKDVAIGLLVAWLYDKLKGNEIRTLRINRVQIEISPEAITKVISESIEVEEER